MYDLLISSIRKNPFIRILIPFIIGIVLCINIDFSSFISISIFTVSSLAFILFSLKKQKFSQVWISGIFINLIFISAAMFLTQSLNEKAIKNLDSNKQGNLIGIIDKEPKIMEASTKVELNIIALKNQEQWIETSGSSILYIENNEEVKNLKIGDKIIFTPDLQEVENKGNPEEFDYKKYLSYNLILSTDYLSSSEWKILKEDKNLKLQHRFSRFRNKLIELLQANNLKDDELAVVSALALGYQDSLSDELRHAYSSAGAMHILAVSGMHVGIVYGMIIFLLSFFKSEKLRLPKVFLSIILVWAYAFLTGLSPSVSRAALMFSIMALGNIQKHKSSSLNAVAASAFILLLINPYNLVKLGFQLSYIAVIGIILLNEPIYQLVNPKNKIIDKIWSLTAVSLAAQIVTAPLGMFYFNQFSNYFLITNYLLIPISSVAIWMIIIVFILSPIPVLSAFVSKILVYIIKAMNFCALGIESLPFSVSNDIYINLPQLVLLYLIIIFVFIFFFNSKLYRHLVYALGFIIIFLGISLFNDLETSKQKYFIVYNMNKSTVINIINANKNIVFASLDAEIEKNIEYSAKNNWLKKGLEQQKYVDLSTKTNLFLANLISISDSEIFYKNNFISFSNLRVYVLNENFKLINSDNESKKLDVDYIVFSNNPQIKLSEIPEYFNFKEIIIDASNYKSNTDKWIAENQDLNFKLFDIREQGAFVLKIE
ncbi:MAG: competence protein ComEC family protein [Bacteroidales bacterium]|nr:competence protein ComEC family protein [Bacteroidales bacterium]